MAKLPETIRTGAPLQVAGVRLASAAAGLRYHDRDDVALIELCEGATAAGVFTANRFKAAPVVLAQAHLSQASPRYLLVNAGIANAGVGKQGLQDAGDCCKSLARSAGVAIEAVLPFSTGIIGQPLPADKIAAVVPDLLQGLRADGWAAAAAAIMTTDTRPKSASRVCACGSSSVTVTGIAKGAGMIYPNMATMLAFVATDIEMNVADIRNLLNQACDRSFNAITVDGDTSTNDACLLLASGRSKVRFVELETAQRDEFERTVSQVMRELAQAIIRDAEGATRFITIRVEGATDRQAARTVGMTVAHSPLVKTALSAGDPNWGRILAAVGRAPVALDINAVDLYLAKGSDELGDEVQVVAQGTVAVAYREAQGVAALAGAEVLIRIVLNAGRHTATVWTSDLTADYVRINADYRS